MSHVSILVRSLVVYAALLIGLAAPATALPSAQDTKTAVASNAAVVNLNTATAEQLDRLPGVGPKTASLIIEYRQKIGGFKKVEDLMNVRGIGEKSFLKLRSHITVTPPKVERPAGAK
jgi:competence protein ComEA